MKPHEGSIVYYVSSHGLGHQVRAAGVIRHIPEEYRLIVRSRSDGWFQQGHLGRSYEWHQGVFDCGAVQTNSLDVDVNATLAEAARLRAVQNIDGEIEFLRAHDARVVVSDIPSFPLYAAKKAGIPSVLIGNFTWCDIYRSYGTSQDEMDEEYRSASLILRTPMALMKDLPVRDIPNIVRPSVNVRLELLKRFSIAPDMRLAFVSVGQWGLPLAWNELEKFRDVAFIAFSGTGPVHSLDPKEWRSQDVVASVDVVISKAGYGTVTECMAGGTPLIFPPREGFAEQAELEKGIGAWGGGIRISPEDFFAFNLRDALREAFAKKMLPVPGMDGGRIAAGIITNEMLGRS